MTHINAYTARLNTRKYHNRKPIYYDDKWNIPVKQEILQEIEKISLEER